LELRLLFNKEKHTNEIKTKNKGGQTPHHPLLKYVNNKNKLYAQSPYTSQIERFESIHIKMKNSTSKNKRVLSNQPRNSRDLNLSLKKNEIHINLHQKDNDKKEEKQETVKTIK
jgi:hypothetical protein